MQRNTTILFQPPNGIGLGHISRLMAIAMAVRAKAPSIRLPFLLEGSSHLLLEIASLPYLSLPTDETLYSTETWTSWPIEERQTIILKIAESIIRQLKPNLILFDTIPCIGVLTAAAACEVPVAICIRKGKDMPNYFALMERYHKQLKYLKLIIIPHRPDEVTVPDHFISRTRFVSQIVRPRPATSVGRRDPDNSKMIVITGGGGGFPNTVDFYNLALVSFKSCRTRNPNINGMLITGPLFQDWRKLSMVDGIRVIPFDPNMATTLASADLIICQGGYNTIAEVTSVATPAICVPAERAVDDQFERAEQAAISYSDFHVCRTPEPNYLAELIDLCLQTPIRERSDGGASSRGAEQAAEALLELIAQ
jgi:UDP-N-acetylglucosamine--N-acetylmuramyl-(pentapeptide) pyrophosphoryl-undecaprenol N-acetylglucosamine transferase